MKLPPRKPSEKHMLAGMKKLHSIAIQAPHECLRDSPAGCLHCDTLHETWWDIREWELAEGTHDLHKGP